MDGSETVILVLEVNQTNNLLEVWCWLKELAKATEELCAKGRVVLNQCI